MQTASTNSGEKNGLLSGARWITVRYCDNSLRFPYATVTWRVLTISQSKIHKKHVANLLWKNLRSLYRVVIWSDKTLFRWIGGQTASQAFVQRQCVISQIWETWMLLAYSVRSPSRTWNEMILICSLRTNRPRWILKITIYLFTAIWHLCDMNTRALFKKNFKIRATMRTCKWNPAAPFRRWSIPPGLKNMNVYRLVLTKTVILRKSKQSDFDVIASHVHLLKT